MDVSGFYIVKGDSTCDGRLTIEDEMLGQMHALQVIKLTGDAFTGADINSDNEVGTIDIANINRHMLGVSMITEVVAK